MDLQWTSLGQKKVSNFRGCNAHVLTRSSGQPNVIEVSSFQGVLIRVVSLYLSGHAHDMQIIYTHCVVPTQLHTTAPVNRHAEIVCCSMSELSSI